MMDGDFRDSHFLNRTPGRLLRITIGNLSNSELIARVEHRWPDIAALAAEDRCYAELSREGLTRVPSPEP